MPDKETPVLPPQCIREVEYVRTLWCVNVPAGHAPEDILAPGYWAHAATSMKGFDKLEVRAEDGSWYAEYLVLDCARTWAKIVPIVGPIRLDGGRLHKPPATSAEITAAMNDYEVKFRGPRLWSVVRISDGAVLKENEHQRETCEGWLRDYVGTFAHHSGNVTEAAA